MSKENFKKFQALVTGNDSSWLEKAKQRKKNKKSLQRSATIAVRVLRILRDKNMTKLELARRMGVTPQQVTKIVKGQENFTLETIENLEKALGVTLMTIPLPQYTYPAKKLTTTPLKGKAATMDMTFTLSGEVLNSLLLIAQKSKIGEEYTMEATNEYKYSEAA